IRKIALRAGITKQISPHLFRHSAATRFAVEMPTQVFVKQMGWSSNKMADNYTHLDKSGQITAILKAHNIEITDEELNKPVSMVTRRCPRCHVVNTGGARFCSNCGSPLKAEDFIKVESERQKVMETLKAENMISPEMQSALDVLPEDARLDLLATLLLKMEKEGKLDELRRRVRK
ncbi:MAG: site-specific integrase, partial [Thermoplasmatales archaeon]